MNSFHEAIANKEFYAEHSPWTERTVVDDEASIMDKVFVKTWPSISAFIALKRMFTFNSNVSSVESANARNSGMLEDGPVGTGMFRLR